MSYAEQAQREAATVRPRTFSIELSDADVIRIFEKAGSVGFTPGELLANFIGDLVDGTYSNGSDERTYAENWFDRCGFSYSGNKSFLTYLLYYGCLDRLIELVDDLEGYNEDYALLDESDEDYKDDKEYLDEAIRSCKEEIQELFDDYRSEDSDSAEYETEINKIKAYRESLKNSLSENLERNGD